MGDLDAKIKNLLKANNVLMQDFFAKSVTDDDMKKFDKHMRLLFSQLEFWTIRDNKERFHYDLSMHIRWMLNNYF